MIFVGRNSLIHFQNRNFQTPWVEKVHSSHFFFLLGALGSFIIRIDLGKFIDLSYTYQNLLEVINSSHFS